jgi:hypothetical protein
MDAGAGRGVCRQQPVVQLGSISVLVAGRAIPIAVHRRRAAPSTSVPEVAAATIGTNKNALGSESYATGPRVQRNASRTIQFPAFLAS